VTTKFKVVKDLEDDSQAENLWNLVRYQVRPPIL